MTSITQNSVVIPGQAAELISEGSLSTINNGVVVTKPSGVNKITAKICKIGIITYRRPT